MDDAREAYWHEGEPRIVASGRWEQDEYGDTTYIPDHIRPSTAAPSAKLTEAPDPDDAGRGHDHEAPEARDGYRVHSGAIWTAARRDYLDGDAAEAVCARPFPVEASALSDVSDSVFAPLFGEASSRSRLRRLAGRGPISDDSDLSDPLSRRPSPSRRPGFGPFGRFRPRFHPPTAKA